MFSQHTLLQKHSKALYDIVTSILMVVRTSSRLERFSTRARGEWGRKSKDGVEQGGDGADRQIRPGSGAGL